MDHEFIYPNWHVVLIHYPLALLTIGVLVEILSFFWRRSTVRVAGRWMILIGALASIPTATLGLYALRDVVTPGPIDDHATWQQVAERSPWTQHQWEHMESHLWFEVGGTLLAVFAAVVWLACSDNGRRRFYWPALVLLLIALGVMSAGAWYSGEAVYRHGVAVSPQAASPAPPSEPVTPGTAPAATQPDVSAALEPEGQTVLVHNPSPANHEHAQAASAGSRRIRHYIPPLQLHLLLAGVTVAIALGAVGITIRRWGLLRSAVPVAAPGASEGARVMEVPDYRLRPEASTPRPPPLDPRPVGPVALPPVYPGRVWLWALFFAVGTALAGLWFTGDWELRGLTEGFTNEFAIDRLFGHVLFGSTIALLLLLGVLLTWAAPRHRFLTVLVILLLLAAVAGQVWLGVLLLFDSMSGPVTGFN